MVCVCLKGFVDGVLITLQGFLSVFSPKDRLRNGPLRLDVPVLGLTPLARGL